VRLWNLLLWHIVGCALLGPLLLGPFTLGVPLVLYLPMFSMSESSLRPSWIASWTIHQFIRFAVGPTATGKPSDAILPRNVDAKGRS
jgi:hypothetical protein